MSEGSAIVKPYPVPVSAGVLEGMTPFESLLAAGQVVTPEQEFGGRPKPNFLRDELEAGARAIAEEKRLAEERAKSGWRLRRKTIWGEAVRPMTQCSR
jgi:hypothetical protein